MPPEINKPKIKQPPKILIAIIIEFFILVFVFIKDTNSTLNKI